MTDTSPEREADLIDARRKARDEFNRRRGALASLDFSRVKTTADINNVLYQMGQAVMALDRYGDRADDLRKLYKARCDELATRCQELEARCQKLEEALGRETTPKPKDDSSLPPRFASIKKDLLG